MTVGKVSQIVLQGAEVWHELRVSIPSLADNELITYLPSTSRNPEYSPDPATNSV